MSVYEDTVAELVTVTQRLRDADALGGETALGSTVDVRDPDALARDLTAADAASERVHLLYDEAIRGCWRLYEADGFDAVGRAIDEAGAGWLVDVFFIRAVSELQDREENEDAVGGG